jgi:hypothetical protein
MMRWRHLLGLIVLSAGCAADNKQGDWSEVWKDLRGDNMQMRSNFSKMTAADDELARPKLRD